MRTALLTGFLGLVALAGCGSSSEQQACMGTVKSAIVGGGARAELLEASTEQMRAVVELILDAPPGAVCSGLLIAPDWVLSAEHCAEAATILGVRLDAARVPVLEIHGHPTLDLVLLKLPPGSSSVAPIEPDREPVSTSLVGHTAQIAGHGVGSPDGTPGFLAVTIEGVDAEHISVNAAGRGGACLGDSGGPLLVRGVDGAVRAIGILSAGSATCRGRDRYTRIDAGLLFLESLTGPLRSGAPPDCGELGAAGRCYGDRAIWCENGAARAAACGSSTACGWDGGAGGFRCVAPELDPCAGIDDLGQCEGDVALRCDAGKLVSTACSSCGSACTRSPASGRAGCG